ncbi:MAG: MgtC/SapB family protein [Hyphomicrobiales bacterium]
MTPEAQGVAGIAVAAIGGLAIGVERQWSGHASGPDAHLGGIRTFTLLGILAGIAGWVWSLGGLALAAVLAALAGALVIASYVASSRREAFGTTETAALVVVAAGVLAGAGYLALASGVIAVTALLLVEKSRLHAAVAKVDDAEIRAAIRFAVMAVVVLPLLPEGPFGPLGGIRPRQLWLLVLFFSGISFAGFLARRLIGLRRGYTVAGLLGGLVSSTAVTFTLSRTSRDHPGLSRPLAAAVLAACAVMYARVLLATAVLNLDLMSALLPYLVAPFFATVVVTMIGRGRGRAEPPPDPGPANPLELKAALQLAGLFQLVLFAVHAARTTWGDVGLAVSGGILGLTDMDALTISMARSASDPAALHGAAQAVAVGVVSNTLFKGAAAAVLGRGALRWLVPALLLVTAAVGVAAILFLR